MDKTERKIMKIDRVAQMFTAKALKDTGIGLSEYEFIHCIRHNPGLSQNEIARKLNQDKAGIARRTANLMKKGYICTRPDESDGRIKRVYATEKAQKVKESKEEVESFFYKWLMEEVPEDKLNVFLEVLDQIYWKSKLERRADFYTILEQFTGDEKGGNTNEPDQP